MEIDRTNVTRGSLTAEQVEELTDILTRHFGEPVRPVSAYCKAFEDWASALAQRKERIVAMADDDPLKQHEFDDTLSHIADMAFQLSISIRKSNLLWRLIYEGQPLRTEMCPEHHGRWSGYQWDRFCECQNGYDVTGWLPNHRLTLPECISRFAKSKGDFCTWLTHFPASPDYRADGLNTVATAMGKTARGHDLKEAAAVLANLLHQDGFVEEDWQPK